MAARWASELMENGMCALPSAVMTAGSPTAYPTRRPASPYALENVRRMTGF